MGRSARSKRLRREVAQVRSGHPVDRLEQMLVMWEFQAALKEVISRHPPKSREGVVQRAGPVIHGQELRAHLLQAASGQVFDRDRFVGPESVRREFGKGGQGMVTLPELLYQWSASSRRVFQLDEDLQLLLENTSLDGVLWGEVPWPFESFVVIPALPVHDAKGREYDCILVGPVTSSTGKKSIEFKIVSKDFGRTPVTDRSYQQKVLSALEGKNIAESTKIWEEFKQEHQRNDLATFSWYLPERMFDLQINETQLGSNLSVEWSSWGDVTNVGPELFSATRLVVGLCLYLKMLAPSKVDHKSDWRRPNRPGDPDPNSITRESEVCVVKSVNVLSPEEKQVFRQGRSTGIALSAHFRRGHWRRPPGRGDDPAAEKSVHVRPTLVRPDRLVERSLPGGVQSSVRK